jgi:hypothetical protein
MLHDHLPKSFFRVRDHVLPPDSITESGRVAAGGTARKIAFSGFFSGREFGDCLFKTLLRERV